MQYLDAQIAQNSAFSLWTWKVAFFLESFRYDYDGEKGSTTNKDIREEIRAKDTEKLHGLKLKMQIFRCF